MNLFRMARTKSARIGIDRPAALSRLDRSLTPVHRAAISGDTKILGALLRSGKADVETKDLSCRTPLHHAVICGHLEAVELLLAHKAPLEAQDEDSYTPLLLAVVNRQLEIFSLLLKNGASVSTLSLIERTPLHYAAENGCIEIAKILLDNRVSPHSQDDSGLIALDFAVYYQHWDVVKLLLNEGRRCWVSSQPRDENNTLVATIDDQAVLSILREETQTGYQYPLEVAARLGREDILYQLCNVYGCRPAWSSSLSLAVENGSQECIKMLLSYGARINTPSLKCRYPLNSAIRLRHDVMTSILLDAGAEPPPALDPGYLEDSSVTLLAKRGPSVATQLLSHIKSLNTLSKWLLEFAEFKHVGVLREYFRTVAPSVRSRYASQPDLLPAAVLVQHLIQNCATVGSDTKPRARASTSHIQDIQSAIMEALDDKFVGVFFLVFIINPELLTEVLRNKPSIREEIEMMLPSRLDLEMDRDLISCLLNAGYELPPVPEDPPSQQHILYTMCEAGHVGKVQKQLQEGVEDINAAVDRNRTALHTAAQEGHLDVVKLLVDHGADLKAMTLFGSTAEKIAEMSNRPLVAAFLKTARRALESSRS
jgi:ankyrin repeat protein